VRLVYPYVAGRYEVDGMTLLVSRGTGFWGPPMRLFRPSEINVITLKKA
jgi:predicted MPP superfamily phosphohydrolase